VDASKALVVGDEGLDLAMARFDAVLEGADRRRRGGMCEARFVKAREGGGRVFAPRHFAILRMSGFNLMLHSIDYKAAVECE